MPTGGWISEPAFQDAAIPTAAYQDLSVTGPKIADATIDVAKLSATLLSYVLSVGRIDYSNMDYCKIG